MRGIFNTTTVAVVLVCSICFGVLAEANSAVTVKHKHRHGRRHQSASASTTTVTTVSGGGSSGLPGAYYRAPTTAWWYGPHVTVQRRSVQQGAAQLVKEKEVERTEQKPIPSPPPPVPSEK